MRKSISDISKEAHFEAGQKTREAIASNLFVFKAQMLLSENETLFANGKYEEVLWNCERILGIIGREDSLNLMDTIQALLAQIKNYIKAVAQDNEDVDVVKNRALKVEADLMDGNYYRAKRDLSEILTDTNELRQQNLIGWSRYTGVELNDKMDTIMAEYKGFPGNYFKFVENPLDTLSGFLEDIMYSTLTEEYVKLDETVVKFYNFYYQFERFLREEKALLGQDDDKGLIKIVLDKDGEPVKYDVIVDPSQSPGVEHGAMDGIYSELRQIDTADQAPSPEEKQVEIGDLVDKYVERENILEKEKIIPPSEKKRTKMPKIKALLKKGIPFGKEAKKKKKVTKGKKKGVGEESWEHKQKKFDALVASTAFKNFCGDVIVVDEDDLARRLLVLETRGFKFFLNSDYGKALLYYHWIVQMDPRYKDAWKKRDECYKKLPDGIK